MYELIVIGGGPAGLAAALAAHAGGLRRIAVIERDREPGGILNQCIHGGFGLHYFGEELTGPEYAARFADMLRGTGIELLLDTMALELAPGPAVRVVSGRDGYRTLESKTVVLAMGCRERTRGAIAIPGSRPSGVLTAGAAQRYVNIEGYMPGRRVVILGSGDIGLIMARRMTLEGAKVLACVELMPYSSGLNRNIVQCLHDFGIPLYLSHTVTDIRGYPRLSGVTVSRVDEARAPVPGSEMSFDCDTLLLSVGLIPENELTRAAGIEMDARTGGAVVFENMETSLPGVFACGNAAHVHDLVDFVSEESARAGAAAAEFALRGGVGGGFAAVSPGLGVAYTVPQRVRAGAEALGVSFRVTKAHEGAAVLVRAGGEQLFRKKRPHMTPGEMERVTVPAQAMERARGRDLEISVEGGDAK